MSTLHTWHELSTDGTDEVVLAADFDLAGRKEARFVELVPLLEKGFTVWMTDPRAVASEPGDDAESSVKQWVDEVEAHGKTVLAMLGFCGGSMYAGAIAEEVERRQGDFPLTLLFDPERPSALGMFLQFRKALDLMAPALTPAQLGTAQDAGQRAQYGSANLTELATKLLEIFHAIGRIAFDRLGIDEVHQAEFTATVRIFLAYMAAAEQLDPDPAWRRATAISSATPTSGLNGVRTLNPGMVIDTVATELRFDVAHVDLLRTREVAQAVSRLIKGQP